MARDLHRAALAVMSIFAVVLAATLFPATGFGANPVPAGSETGPDTGDPADGGTTVDDELTGTTTPDQTTVATETTSSTEETGTTIGKIDEPTTAETTTPAAYDDSSSGGMQGSLLAVFFIFLSASIAFVASAVGFGRHHRRRYPNQWDLPSAPHLRLLVYVRRIPQTSLAFVMFAGETAPGILDQFGKGFANASTGIGNVATGLGRLGAVVGGGLATLPAGFVRGVGGLGRSISSFTLGLSLFTSGIGTGSLFGTSSDRPGRDPRSGGRDAPTPPAPTDPDPPSTVREAWARFQDDLGIGGADGRTPGEIARRAVDRGLPTDAIRSLTRAYRDVRYGGRPDDGERASRASEAYRRIKTALDGDSS